MRRFACAVALVLLMVSSVFAQNPGGSNAYGKSLTDWMTGYWSWFFGGSADNGEKNVVFVPLPAGVQTDTDPLTFTGVLDVDWRVGDAFALPMFFWIGEEYEDGSQDDPATIADGMFTGASVKISLDGKVIFDSHTDDLSNYLIGSSYFPDLISYAEPTSYGAVGAVWVKGIGFVHPPLSKGQHTLHLFVFSPDLNLVYDNTWNITVAK